MYASGTEMTDANMLLFHNGKARLGPRITIKVFHSACNPGTYKIRLICDSVPVYVRYFKSKDLRTAERVAWKLIRLWLARQSVCPLGVPWQTWLHVLEMFSEQNTEPTQHTEVIYD